MGQFLLFVYRTIILVTTNMIVLLKGDLMYLIFVVIAWIIIGYFVVDWKDWRKFYPTVLYYWASNLLYDYLYYNHSLWVFKAVTTDSLNHTIILLSFLFIIIPVAILAYLQHFPQNAVNKAIYIFIWTTFFWIVEFLFYKMDMFVYGNGWNIWHSAWFDLLMFIMFRLHYKKPLTAIGLSAISVIAFTMFFPIPFKSLK